MICFTFNNIVVFYVNLNDINIIYLLYEVKPHVDLAKRQELYTSTIELLFRYIQLDLLVVLVDKRTYIILRPYPFTLF